MSHIMEVKSVVFTLTQIKHQNGNDIADSKIRADYWREKTLQLLQSILILTTPIIHSSQMSYRNSRCSER